MESLLGSSMDSLLDSLLDSPNVHSNDPGTNSYHGICSELNIPSSEIKAAQRNIDETLKVGAQVVHQIESYRILRVGRAPILVTLH